METLFILALNGLIWGLIIALIALGLSIIFGLLDVINIAHGDFFMLGSIFAWFTIQFTGNFWIAILIVPVIGFGLGALCEFFVIRPIKNAAALTIVATFGLSIFLQESVRATYGATPKRLMTPINDTFLIFSTEYEFYRVFAALFSIILITGFFLFLHKTKIGIWMRAVRFNPEIATAMGIPTKKIYMFTFALGFALAAQGGVIAAPITTVDFQSGIDILPFCFMAVIIGGLGNLEGTVAAALILSTFEGIVTTFSDPTFARICSLILMCTILILRPHGIFSGAKS